MPYEKLFKSKEIHWKKRIALINWTRLEDDSSCAALILTEMCHQDVGSCELLKMCLEGEQIVGYTQSNQLNYKHSRVVTNW